MGLQLIKFKELQIILWVMGIVKSKCTTYVKLCIRGHNYEMDVEY